MTLRVSVARVFWILLLTCAAALAGAQNLAAGQRKHGICGTCQGIEGRTCKIHYPILAEQSEQYLFVQLNYFNDGRRSYPSMDAIAPQFGTHNMRDLAVLFASPKSRPSRFISDSGKAA